jgi:hypothetical protein
MATKLTALYFRLAAPFCTAYDNNMSPIEFQTELHGESSLQLPPEVVEQLPKSGRATVVLLVEDDSDDAGWRRAAYEQFMKDDDAEDAVYDSYQ